MKLRRLALATLAAAVLAGGASAHHAFNMFDNEKSVSMTGVVKSFTWHNPHAMLELAAMGPDGSEQLYTVELSAPNIIGRRGWSKDSLKVGDKVPVVVHPMKDGSRYGLMMQVTTPSGQVLKDKA